MPNSVFNSLSSVKIQTKNNHVISVSLSFFLPSFNLPQTKRSFLILPVYVYVVCVVSLLILHSTYSSCFYFKITFFLTKKIFQKEDNQKVKTPFRRGLLLSLPQICLFAGKWGLFPGNCFQHVEACVFVVLL